ncbi:hypothetical protein M1M87_00895 [Thermodesulfovibrionales bacterium]|nr:hypothetical protein [Thermodesulfovibrionales bacterium]
MARRKIAVRDFVDIYEQWQGGLGKKSISRSLGFSKNTVRKYLDIAEESGIKQNGPKLSRADWIKLVHEKIAPHEIKRAGFSTAEDIRPYHGYIRERLSESTGKTIWSRLESERGLVVSYSSFKRYLREYFRKEMMISRVRVLRIDPAAGEEAQIDFGRLGYMGSNVHVRVSAKTVEIYNQNEQLIKTHLPVPKGKRQTDYHDYPPEKAQFYQRHPQWCLAKAQEIGTWTYQVTKGLLKTKAFNYLRQCQGIIRLTEQYGTQRVEAACCRAITFDTLSYRTIKNMLKAGYDTIPAEGEAQLILPLSGGYLHGADKMLDLDTEPPPAAVSPDQEEEVSRG